MPSEGSADVSASGIDRIAPTRRPEGRSAMRQRWAELLFLHWAVPAESLRCLLPSALHLDTFEGKAYVGLVPFTMTGVRPSWAPPLPLLSSFHEVNVRTYVHRGGRDPGVWFFSLDAARTLAVLIARALWKLPYHLARMSLVKESERIRYSSERLWPGPVPACCALAHEPTGTATPAIPGTLEHFLVERYILYASSRGRLYQGRVHHSPYPLQTARVGALEETLLAAAGIARPDAPPLTHYAREVSVEVFPLRELPI